MVKYSDTGGGKMSYTANIHYILERDTSVELKSETIATDKTIGGHIDFYFYDFESDGVNYYVKYALGNGDIFYRGNTNDVTEDRIYAGNMVISENEKYSHWFVFCTDDESEILGDSYVSVMDIANEIYLSITGTEITTKGSDSVIRIDITNGAVGESFVSYGSTFSPRLSCDMFSCEFTDYLSSDAFRSDESGQIVNARLTIRGQEEYPIPMGRFFVRDEPTFTEETVSFNGIGIMEGYMERAKIDIEALNLYHKDEIEEKYVKNGFMDWMEYGSDFYFWEFLPEDFYRVTGCPLYIDHWNIIKRAIYDYRIPQLMIPCLESFSQTPITDDEGKLIDYEYEKEYKSRITWRELLSGISILLRANVIEKNGAFYIKQLPDVKRSGYRDVFDASSYDNSAQFGKRPMCPSKIYVRGNNWYFYQDISTGKKVGFGYYKDEKTLEISGYKSSEPGVVHYPVTIECPWILFETRDRDNKNYKGQYMYLWFWHDEPMRWQTALSRWNKAFTYHKANYQTVGWHPAMMAGEMNIVEDYDGEKKYVYIGEITIHYDGSVYADISSPCDVDIENTSSSGGYSSTAYSSNDKANQQGAQSQTSAEIKEVEKAIEDSATPGAYSATIPHFEFDSFDMKSMKVTLTEVTE